MDIVNNLVLIFFSLEIKNLRQDNNYIFRHWDDSKSKEDTDQDKDSNRDKSAGVVNNLKTNAMFNQISKPPMRFLEFSIEPQAMDPNMLYI